jgi:hypothetical protein
MDKVSFFYAKRLVYELSCIVVFTVIFVGSIICLMGV